MEPTIIAPRGDIGLANLAELKQALADALGTGARVDLREVEAVDLAALQLIESARRSYAARGRTLAIADSAAGVWRAARAAAGFPAPEAEAT